MPALVETLRAGKPGGFLDYRAEIVEALGEIGSQESVPALLEIISNRKENEYTVRDAIWSLGQIRASAAAPILVEAIHGQPRQNQVLMIVVLGQIGDPIAVNTIAEFLGDAGKADGGNRVGGGFMCDFAADALRRIGSADALKAVKEWQGL